MRIRTLLVCMALLGLAHPVEGKEPETWVSSLPPNRVNFTTVSLFPDGTGYVFQAEADVPGSLLWKTRDFGVTYDRVERWGDNSLAHMVKFGTPELGWAVDGGLRRVSGADLSWERVTMPRPDDPSVRWMLFNGLALADEGRVVATGASFRRAPPECGASTEDDTVGIYTSADGGQTWDIDELPVSGDVRALSYLDESHGAVLTATSGWVSSPGPLGTCVTEDQGTPIADRLWVTEQDEDGETTLRLALECEPVDCSAVAMASSELIIVGTADGTLRRSADGGKTFQTVALVTGGPPDLVNESTVGSIAFADPLVGYAATVGRGLYRTIDGGLTWLQETSPQVARGSGWPDLAVASPDHALASGPMGVLRRGVRPAPPAPTDPPPHITDIAGDANGLNAAGVEQDARPASSDPADLLAVRLETTYETIPVGQDGIRHEPTGLAIHLKTLGSPDLFGPETVVYRLDSTIAGCRSYLEAVVSRDPDGEGPHATAYWDQIDGPPAACPDGKQVGIGSGRSPEWTATIDTAGRELTLTYPFSSLSPRQAQFLKAGNALIAPHAETRSLYRSLYDLGTDTRTDYSVLIDRTATGADFVIGSDVPPDIPCTEGCS